MSVTSLLNPVLEIALEAGEKILAIYHSDFAVTHKDDDSPLTQADLAAHTHIATELKILSPTLPVLSEEAAAIPYAERKRWPRYWLVDPLDGTKEFIKRNGEFTVNIALIENQRPILGVVHAPAKSESYAAAQGAGAMSYRNAQKYPIRVRPRPSRPQFLISRSHRDEALERVLRHAPPFDALGIGSSLKFCRIAEGAADLYLRTGPTSEWDTAAGHCVLEQAGGAVWQLPQKTALAYNQKDSLLNPGFAAVGDANADWNWLTKG